MENENLLHLIKKNLMKYITFLALVLCQQAISQHFIERELETSISEVTIYLQGGLVTRTSKTGIPQGKSIFKVKSLSPYIDHKSVQVKATGDFTILSVNPTLNYLNRLKKDQKIDSLGQQVKALAFEISTYESRLQVLSEKQSLLDVNKKLGGEASGASLTQVRQAIEFYDKELTSIKSEEISIDLKIKDLKERNRRIEQEISDVRGRDELPTGEIEIRIESNQQTSGEFKISYLVANTGWYPKYDARVASVERPLELKYKADVYQNTGVDWENVKLKLSNGDPNQSGVAPELATWYLNYARNTFFNQLANRAVSSGIRNVSGKILDENGEPVTGATVVVKGTAVGTVTDLDGNYSLTLPNGATHLTVSFIGYNQQELPISSPNISTRLVPSIEQLQEVVVAHGSAAKKLQGKAAGVRIRGVSTIRNEANRVATTTVENQTTVEFEVDDPYSIKSNGEKLSIDLNSFEIETLYQYYAVPKLDKDAFLMARIINWDQYNLLEGEVNLYFEEAYVGRSILDARSLEDTLNISLGRDKSLVIGREKIDEYSKRKTIGGSKMESRGFKIMARNKKSETIKLILFDQIPVAVISDITVTPTELSNGKLTRKTGEIVWELELKPQQQTELNLNYEVKYPKNEKINLE